MADVSDVEVLGVYVPEIQVLANIKNENKNTDDVIILSPTVLDVSCRVKKKRRSGDENNNMVATVNVKHPKTSDCWSASPILVKAHQMSIEQALRLFQRVTFSRWEMRGLPVTTADKIIQILRFCKGYVPGVLSNQDVGSHNITWTKIDHILRSTQILRDYVRVLGSSNFCDPAIMVKMADSYGSPSPLHHSIQLLEDAAEFLYDFPELRTSGTAMPHLRTKATHRSLMKVMADLANLAGFYLNTKGEIQSEIDVVLGSQMHQVVTQPDLVLKVRNVSRQVHQNWTVTCEVGPGAQTMHEAGTDTKPAIMATSTHGPKSLEPLSMAVVPVATEHVPQSMAVVPAATGRSNPLGASTWQREGSSEGVDEHASSPSETTTTPTYGESDASLQHKHSLKSLRKWYYPLSQEVLAHHFTTMLAMAKHSYSSKSIGMFVWRERIFFTKMYVYDLERYFESLKYGVLKQGGVKYEVSPWFLDWRNSKDRFALIAAWHFMASS